MSKTRTDEALRVETRKGSNSESGGVASRRLRSIVDRIERLEEERKALGADIKDIYSEAKGAGFDVKALRTLIRRRKFERATLDELDALLDVYERAMEMGNSGL